MDNKNIVEIKSIIQDLKTMGQYGEGVDGETMQYILQQVGMEWQMLRQLMLRMPIQQVEYLFEERKELESIEKALKITDDISRNENIHYHRNTSNINKMDI